MKKYQTILTSVKAILFFVVITASINCSKLQLEPQGQLSVESTLSDYNGFKTYAWQFYNTFTGYTNAMLNKDVNSDLFLYANSNSQSN